MEDPVGLAPREDINQKQTLVAKTMDEAGMNCLAPNLLGIVGAAVASKLVEVAGSLMNLSKIESSHIAFCGFWTETSEKERVFYLDGAELIRDTPPILRNRFRRLLAASCRLAAQVDSTNSDPTGETGKMLRDKILKQINIHTLHALHL